MRSLSQRILFFFINVSLLFFIINRAFFFSPSWLETLSSRIVYPVLIIQKNVAERLQSWKQKKQSVEDLSLVVHRLLQENDFLRSQLIEQAAAEHFLQESEEARSFKDRYFFEKAQLAHVIFRHLGNDEQYYLVDVGSQQGIYNDMVAVYKDCLVGRVVAVYPYYSKIRLITDRLCPIAVYFQKTNTHGIHSGIHALNKTRVTHISHLSVVEEQDLVLSSGEGLIFPQGFLLGIISEAYKQGMYYNITVEPAIDVAAVSYCYLVQKNGLP